MFVVPNCPENDPFLTPRSARFPCKNANLPHCAFLRLSGKYGCTEVRVYPTECGEQLGTDPWKIGSSKSLLLKTFSGEEHFGTVSRICRNLVARAIRNAIRANRFATRIIRNWNPYFYSASGRFARITRISDSRDSPDSRESCESIRANHATKCRKFSQCGT